MSVADQLGLRDETSELLALADQRWGRWAIAYPALTHCCGVLELRSWLRGAAKAEADEALHALASLAAVNGGDDIAAAAALAWALMPGACTLANRLRTLGWRIDEIVAAQLWVEVRTFPWRRMRKVAANVLLNTRTGVLRDCNAKSQLERTDPTWSRTSPVDPYGTFWGGYASTHCERPTHPGQELLELLQCLREQGHHRRRPRPAAAPRGGRRRRRDPEGRPGHRRAPGQRHLQGGCAAVGHRAEHGAPPRPPQRGRPLQCLHRKRLAGFGMNGDRQGRRSHLRSIEVMSVAQAGQGQAIGATGPPPRSRRCSMSPAARTKRSGCSAAVCRGCTRFTRQRQRSRG